jgi:hypothetical protein
MTQIKDYVDKYKLQLITALDYDKDFVEDVKKRYKGISSYQVAEAARNGNYRVPSVAAADVMEYIKPIDFYRIKDDSLGGEWVFYGSKICEQFIMEIHFEFSREKSGEDNGRVPFFLEVDIMLEDSEKLKQETPVTIPLLNTLENEEGAVIGIKSSRRTINYTNGFSFTRKKITP